MQTIVCDINAGLLAPLDVLHIYTMLEGLCKHIIIYQLSYQYVAFKHSIPSIVLLRANASVHVAS